MFPKLSWKARAHSWQEQPRLPEEGTVPVPNSTFTALVETLPPNVGESSTNEQPMKAEPSPVERQPSPREGLPGLVGSQVLPDPAGQPPSPEEEQ